MLLFVTSFRIAFESILIFHAHRDELVLVLASQIFLIAAMVSLPPMSSADARLHYIRLHDAHHCSHSGLFPYVKIALENGQAIHTAAYRRLISHASGACPLLRLA